MFKEYFAQQYWSDLLKFQFSIRTGWLSFQSLSLTVKAVLLYDLQACLCLTVAVSSPPTCSPFNHDKSLLNAAYFLISSSSSWFPCLRYPLAPTSSCTLAWAAIQSPPRCCRWTQMCSARAVLGRGRHSGSGDIPFIPWCILLSQA